MIGTTAIKLNNLSKLPTKSTCTYYFHEWSSKRVDGKAINTAFVFEDRERLTPAMKIILSEIYTYSNSYDTPKKLSYAHMMSKYRMGRQTVAESLRQLKKLNLISKSGRSRYTFTPAIERNDYTLINDCIFTDDYTVVKNKKGVLTEQTKKLTKNAVIVLHEIIRLYSYCKANKTKFVSSQNKLAKALNLPSSTVGGAILELVGTGLITRRKATPKLGDYDKEWKDKTFTLADDKDTESVGDGYSLTAYIPAAKLLKIEHPKKQSAPAAQNPVSGTKKKTQKPLKELKSKRKTKELNKEYEAELAKLRAKRTQQIQQYNNLLEEFKNSKDYQDCYRRLTNLQDRQIWLQDPEWQELQRRFHWEEPHVDVPDDKLEEAITEADEKLQSLNQAFKAKFGYLENPPCRCHLCQDTGKVNGKWCQCYHDYLKDKGYYITKK